ncbi:hypothetical protein BR93DRAFT_929855 [Coniochaeta sp. PMI_546]|nr:hypothetical protein BR93DRAFT_929855 [Coniochaeta sp. PMI_546]
MLFLKWKTPACKSRVEEGPSSVHYRAAVIVDLLCINYTYGYTCTVYTVLWKLKTSKDSKGP